MVLNKILELIEDTEPKFNNPVGKGTSIILTLQRFAYGVLEKSILDMVEKSRK